jgi:aldehyde dehydrogenase
VINSQRLVVAGGFNNMSIAIAQKTSTVFQEEYGHFIDGRWEAGASGETITQFNPATGEALSRIQAGSPPDVDRAVRAARAAFPSWSRSTAGERQALLMEIANRLRRRAAEFARMESLNNGKTLAEALAFDLPHSCGQFELFAGAAYSLHGETRDYADTIGLVHREAIGVCAQIIPWNVPLLMLSLKIAPALAAGNTVVLKPAETVCLAVLEFMREMADIIPPGVVNIVTGYGADVGEALVGHPEVRKVAFTGSIPTARKVIQYASINIIPQTMELGGKSAHIICSSADLDAAAESAALSTVFNKGEACIAGSRVFVHRAIREPFLEKFVGIIKRIRQGDPLAEGTQIGAMASQAQFDKVMGYLRLARDEGAEVLVGGDAATEGPLGNGLFIQPTILDGVRNDMRIAQEEIFGPVTSVITWDDEVEMIRQANATKYGLAGGIWTRDLNQAHKLARAMETGVIYVNRYYNMPPGMPVGGYKQSGFGREMAHDILKDYTVTKSVMINLSEGPMGLFA